MKSEKERDEVRAIGYWETRTNGVKRITDLSDYELKVALRWHEAYIYGRRVYPDIVFSNLLILRAETQVRSNKAEMKE